MSRSVAVTISVFAVFLITAYCQVIVNSENEYEGSLCYTKAGGPGVCRQSCGGSNGTSQGSASDICNSGKLPVLYCCVDQTFAQLYPTLHKGCTTRLLARNFNVKRGRQSFHAQNKLNEIATKNYMRSMSLQETCNKDALEIEPAERANYLKYCNKFAAAEYSSLKRGVRNAFFKDPSIAGVGFFDGDNNIRWICGGHFIHALYVLTSASCIRDHPDVPNIVRFGSEDLYNGNFYSTSNAFSRTFVIEDIITKNYDKESLRDDIALLKVARDPNAVPDYLLQLSPIPACLWSQNEIPKENLTVIGYTHVLNSGDVSPTDLTECAKKLDGGELDDTRICVVCNFENKGSITASLQYEEKSLLMHVPRLVAMGSCRMPCKDNEPAHFTLIYPHLEWIESVISDN